jgi:hypothetical protein
MVASHPQVGGNLAVLLPISLSVAFWPYDVGSDKKVTIGKRMRAAGLDLDFGLHLSTRRSGEQNLMRVYTGLH